MTVTQAEAVLTTGNSAKLYCLQWIEQQIQAGGPLTILDLGCGTANNFTVLLKRYPDVTYVGVEPSSEACQIARKNLAGRNATIINAYAYDVYRQINNQFDVIVSFSVLEHVYQRQRYLSSARECLKPGGNFLINYDAGHFVAPAGAKERLKNVVGPVLARLGVEATYQSFVPESQFRTMAGRAGLQIVEAKSFNTMLKGVHKVIPPQHRPEYMRRWLELELWLNDLELPYRDDLARTWFTRNFILRRDS